MKKIQRSPEEVLASFPAEELLGWFQENKRDLPWRGKGDPYGVWISETMLQQTRIETVRDYFRRFLEAFPTVHDLAAAPLDRVLKLWEGLGYYSRARNLKAAAERIDAAGRFPTTSQEWGDLPGIGPYTAAALASICDGEPAPVVDGNVGRVVARYCAAPLDPKDPKTRKEIARWLRPAIESSGSPGDFNEAMMELGETLCLPAGADCKACPLRGSCAACAEGDPTAYPVKAPPKERPVRHFAVFLVRDVEGRPLLRQRPAKGLLGGLWELPSVEHDGIPQAKDFRRIARDLDLGDGPWRPVGELVHDFTHFRQILHLRAAGQPVPAPTGFSYETPERLALTTATKRALASHPAT